ncbi:hypothetical protein C8J56DRAFT_1159869 [Mycena floridula]|nr:hypothetical protein C8J56DRAFT_1159869 [Mycena floridula]
MSICARSCKRCCSQYASASKSPGPSRLEEILSLSRNNASSIDHISASSLIASTKTDVAECNHQIKRYEAEKIRLEGLLVSLRNQKRSLERLEEACQSLVAPIRRIPPEILRNIFILLGAKCKIVNQKTSIDGFTVAAVSHRWRAIALSSKELWMDLTIDPFAVKQLGLLDRLFELSGQSPLRITMFGKAFDAPLVTKLLTQSHRWCYLDVASLWHPREMLEDSRLNLIMLEDIRLRLAAAIRLDKIRHHTPQLRSVAVTGLEYDIWQNNQALFVPIDATLNLISICPNLTSATIRASDIISLQIPHSSSIYKSSLKTLSILDCSSEALDSAFSQVDYPQLTSLTVEGKPSEWSILTFAAMLDRTKPRIECLTLKNVAIAHVAFLELLPSVTSLTLDTDLSKSTLDRMNINLQSISQLLLPNLVELTLSSDKLLVPNFIQMIQSRWLGLPTAGLKSVHVELTSQSLKNVDLTPLKVLKAAGMKFAISDSQGIVSLNIHDDEDL